ncbi:beta-1,2-xylosyltransferase-like [Salvia hispanica]|uniref:beta-1,2-xylosyltransferase-like n=1 Tax=Salvia hispanica TaxID=49212 RepID=UPI0020098D93|nr:beta-1,2-xylosyltransferase-like [Salvia hispanica]
MKESLKKLVVALLALNSISLYLFFSFLPDHRSPFNSSTALLYSPVKPWPILPSYLPWSHNPNTRSNSCEAFFGNGFTKGGGQVLLGSGAGGGWFRCYYSETLKTSVCEGGRIRMIPDKIDVSHGGEILESVIGRNESQEVPDFEDGAFQIEVADTSQNGKHMVDEGFLDKFFQKGEIVRHTVRDLIRSTRLVHAHEFVCSKWIEEPAILVTRFEYANLFHTVTEWYSAYVASRVTGLPNRPHLVFVDGHCEGPLQETWAALFSSLTYAKNFTGPVCFRHAILAPLGYETALFKGITQTIDCSGASAHDLLHNPNDNKTARLSEFGEMIRAAFGFPVDRHHIPEPNSAHNILFVRREDYLAHPRHDGKVESRLSNEQEVFDSINIWASNHSKCRLNVVNGLFAHMPMKEQVRAIQDASVIVGAHGAGLTHIVYATPKTVILEIISSDYRRGHFQLIAQWKGLGYHAIFLSGTHARTPRVIYKLSNILSGLGC